MLSLPLDLKWEIPATTAGIQGDLAWLAAASSCSPGHACTFQGAWGKGTEACPGTACISLLPKAFLELGERQNWPSTAPAGAGNG